MGMASYVVFMEIYGPMRVPFPHKWKLERINKVWNQGWIESIWNLSVERAPKQIPFVQFNWENIWKSNFTELPDVGFYILPSRQVLTVRNFQISVLSVLCVHLPVLLSVGCSHGQTAWCTIFIFRHMDVFNYKEYPHHHSPKMEMSRLPPVSWQKLVSRILKVISLHLTFDLNFDPIPIGKRGTLAWLGVDH